MTDSKLHIDAAVLVKCYVTVLDSKLNKLQLFEMNGVQHFLSTVSIRSRSGSWL